MAVLRYTVTDNVTDIEVNINNISNVYIRVIKQ